MLAGLGAGLLLGMRRQLRDLPRLLSKPHAFIVFLLLENPLLVYAGVLGGLVYGVLTEAQVSGFVSVMARSLTELTGGTVSTSPSSDSPGFC